MRASQTAALSPFAGGVHHVGGPDRHMLTVLCGESWQRVEGPRELSIPLHATVHIRTIIQIARHRQSRTVGELVTVVVLVIRISAKAEHGRMRSPGREIVGVEHLGGINVLGLRDGIARRVHRRRMVAGVVRLILVLVEHISRLQRSRQVRRAVRDVVGNPALRARIHRRHIEEHRMLTVIRGLRRRGCRLVSRLRRGEEIGRVEGRGHRRVRIQVGKGVA